MLSLNPSYYHREFSNDIKMKNPSTAPTWARITLAALPFMGLYKPASFPLSLGMGTLRVVTSLTHLYKTAPQGTAYQTGYQLLHTAIAIGSVAGTLLAHPEPQFPVCGEP